MTTPEPNPSKLVRILTLPVVVHGWAVLLRLPQTIAAAYRAFAPGGGGIPNAEFWAFSERDARFRSWYDKLARDYRTQGRFGYAWDDGLGMALGDKFGSNLLTYGAWGALGTRASMAFGYVTYLAAVFAVCAAPFGWPTAAIVALLFGCAPAILGAYTQGSKPEFIWWGVAFGVIALGFDSPVALGLGWSLLAVLNFTIAVVVGVLVLLPLAATTFLANGTLWSLVLACLPGVLKTLWRMLYVLRSGFLNRFTKEQSAIWRLPWRPLAREVVHLTPYFASLMWSMIEGDRVALGGGLIAASALFYWTNFRVMYHSDIETLHLAFPAVALVFAAATYSLGGLLLALAFVFGNPWLFSFPSHAIDAPRPVSIQDNLAGALRTYPALTPLRYPLPGPLEAFFAQISDGARVIAEPDGNPRTESRLRGFWGWSDDLLPRRQVDFVNDIHTQILEPDVIRELGRTSVLNDGLLEFDELCRELGASYIVALTPAFVKQLQSIGYTVLSFVDISQVDITFARIFAVEGVQLWLLRSPHRTSVVTPHVEWRRTDNLLSWQGAPDTTFVVRYRYNPQFRAVQGARVLPVQPVRPLPNVSTTFMAIRSETAEPIELRFVPRWI